MEIIAFIMDIILIICGVLTTMYAWHIGGSIGHFAAYWPLGMRGILAAASDTAV